MQPLELGLAQSFRRLDPNGSIMDFLSRVADRFPLWNAGVFLAFTAVNVWLLMRLDKDARRKVELQRQWWKSTSTFESDFQKVRSRGQLGYFIFIAISLTCAMLIVYAHVVVYS